MLIDAELQVFETRHWTFQVRSQQVTLGAGVLGAKSCVADFAALSEAEWGDFGCTTAMISTIYERCLRPQKFNYLALMMIAPQVHFHVVPRYKAPVQFGSRICLDADWPDPPNMKASLSLPRRELLALAEGLRKAHAALVLGASLTASGVEIDS